MATPGARRTAVLFFLVSCLFTLAEPARARGKGTYIHRNEGAVVLIRSGWSEPLGLDTPCRDKDILKTNVDGVLEVAMNGVAGFRLLSSSECVLEKTSSSDMHIRLLRGSLIARYFKLPSGASFQVETEDSVAAGDKPGQFWVKIEVGPDKRPSTGFVVRKGTLNVTSKSSGATRVVLALQALDITPETYVPSVRNASESEAEFTEQATEIQVGY